MEFKDCTVGTKVQIKGTIIEGIKDNLSVHVRLPNDEETYISPCDLEPASLKYDPKRKFKRGDIVRPDYKGRKWAGMLDEGIDYEVLEDESLDGQVLIKIDKRIDPNGRGFVDFSRLALIQPIEKRPCPYYIYESRNCFKIRVKLTDKIHPVVYCVFFGAGTGVTKNEARLKAQDLWFEKRREYRESLKN